MPSSPWLRFIPSRLWPSPPELPSTPQGNDPRIGTIAQTPVKIPDQALPSDLTSRVIEIPFAVVTITTPLEPVANGTQDAPPDKSPVSRLVTPPAAVLGQAKTTQAKQPQDFPESLLGPREITPPVTPAGAQFPPPQIAQAKQPQDFPENLLGSRDVVPPPAVLGQAKTIQAKQPQDYAQNELTSREITPPPAPVQQPVPPPQVIQGKDQPLNERTQVSQTLQANPGGGAYATIPIPATYTVQGQSQDIISGVPQPEPLEWIEPRPQVIQAYNAAPPIYGVIVPGDTNQDFRTGKVVQDEPQEGKSRIPFQPPPAPVQTPVPPPVVAQAKQPQDFPENLLGSRDVVPPPAVLGQAKTTQAKQPEGFPESLLGSRQFTPPVAVFTIHSLITQGGTNQNAGTSPVPQPDPPFVEKSKVVKPPAATLAFLRGVVHAGANNQGPITGVVQPDAPFVDSPRAITVPPVTAGAGDNPSGGEDPNYFLLIHA